ncbi:MAG: alkaline phosphatase family protein [Trueperaceae bacterium]|nr:alkaline phosphatase family protein [Trueperaceae bacterium]
MSTLLMIMIDGLSADAFTEHAADLPNLHALAAEGRTVASVAADVPATSLPGRTGILTGVGSERHGVYGNLVLDGTAFRYANPDDVRVPTLPRRAREAGLDVAVMGFGMVRPEDAHAYRGPWWAGEMLQRARDLHPIPADEGWLRTQRHDDPTGRMAPLHRAGLPADVPDAYAGDRLHYLLAELEGDRTMMRWSAGLALQDPPPDLILTEILTPDSVQHVAGPDDPFSRWSLAYADGLVGSLMGELRRAGRLDEATVLITSDHGHGRVEGALYHDAILPDMPASAEGGVLYVLAETPAERRDAEARLAAHGATPLEGTHLPDDVRGRVATFVAPPGHVFEPRPAGTEGATGPSRHRSGHGFAPGTRSDRRVLIARGPGVQPGVRDGAAAADVEATLAELLGLPAFGEGHPLTRS